MSVERLFMPVGALFAFEDDDVVEWLTELICHSAGIDERTRSRM